MRSHTLAVVALALASLGFAFAASRVESASAKPQACAPGYQPCLPVRADLDCDEIADSLKPIRRTGSDPYGLDADGDGLGCEVSGEGGGARSPYGLILRKPPRKEATSASVGDVLTVAGWSPSAAKGERYELCVTRSSGMKCVRPARTLKGTVQTFGVWKVARLEGRGGVFRLSLRVGGRIRAFDTVPLA